MVVDDCAKIFRLRSLTHGPRHRHGGSRKIRDYSEGPLFIARYAPPVSRR